MRSRLFKKKIWLTSDKFKSDLSRLLNFSDDINIYKELPAVTADVHFSNTDFEADEIFSAAALRLGVDESKLRANFQIIGSFVTEFSPNGAANGDSTDALLDDIKESKIVETKDLPKLETLLDAAREVAIVRYYKTQKRKEYETSGLPTLIGISGTVNLRAIFENPYKLGMLITEYSPKCEDLVPVAIMNLRLDLDDTPKNIFFQMTPSGIQLMKNQLEALEKQMEAANNFKKLNSN